MLKKFDELTPEQQKRVSVMYSDQNTVQMYLYNFDAQGNYHGRQYAPPTGKTESGVPFGTIHAESTVKESKPDISYQELHNNPLTEEERKDPKWEYPNDSEKKPETSRRPRRTTKK